MASLGGAPEHPKWYWNLRANPDVEVQDGTETFSARARELDGKERFDWWVRAVEAYPALRGLPGPHPAAHPAVPSGAALTP